MQTVHLDIAVISLGQCSVSFLCIICLQGGPCVLLFLTCDRPVTDRMLKSCPHFIIEHLMIYFTKQTWNKVFTGRRGEISLCAKFHAPPVPTIVCYQSIKQICTVHHFMVWAQYFCSVLSETYGTIYPLWPPIYILWTFASEKVINNSPQYTLHIFSVLLRKIKWCFM